jgi:pimeloyl-ACP methyl ester carboxylesterase
MVIALETPPHQDRSSIVQKTLRIISMIFVFGVAALVVLALITQLGVVVLQRSYPAEGRMIDVAGAGLPVAGAGLPVAGAGLPVAGAELPVAGARLHVVEIGPHDAAGPAIVMIHGASSNLGSMRLPIGDRLAQNHRVILIDRPGHGWSTRDDLENSTPAMQARMLDQALQQLDVSHAILVVHSLAGALGALMALDYPQRVAGLVMLAPVAYPWPGGVGIYNEIVTTPVIGPLLAYTVTLPLGLLLVDPGARNVFLPQTMPEDYVKTTATPLLLRPREFLANAWDLVTLKAAVTEQAPRYGGIKVPVVVISGDVDKAVSTNIHARRFAAAVPNAKLIVIPNLGHMVQNAVPDLVIGEIEAIAGQAAGSQAAAQ